MSNKNTIYHKTDTLRKWAHEEAFIRGDDWPRITCDDILKTIDDLCDEIDEIKPIPSDIDTLLRELMFIYRSTFHSSNQKIILSHEQLIARLRVYLYAAFSLHDEINTYAFDRLLSEAYEAVIDIWELNSKDSLDERTRKILSHITTNNMYAYHLDNTRKKGLVTWLIATKKLDPNT